MDLSILRQITLAFPENGAVTAKTIVIRDGNLVTCSGTALSEDALLKTTARLRAMNNVTDLSHESIRGGKPPLQFAFDFHYGNGGSHEN